MAVKGEASKRGSAERHNAALSTVLVPGRQKAFYEDSNALLKAALHVMG